MIETFRTVVPIVVALVLIVVVPGPNVLAVTTTAMRDRRSGIRMALGVSTGDMIWAAAAIVGLGAALAHARPVFEVLRWAGVVYLIVFAVRLWRTPVNEHSADPGEHDASGRRIFLRGLLIDLANPKAAVFFTTLFASLLPTGLSAGLAVVVLAAVGAVVYGWYLALAVVLSRPVVQRGYRRVGSTINRVAAGAIGVLGIRLALD